MVVISGQHNNVGEKPTVILYIYINRHAGTPHAKQKQTETMCVIIIYCFIGCKDKASTRYLEGFPDGSNLGSTV